MQSSLQEVLKSIKKKYGAEAAMSMADSPQDVDVISTGSLSLDKITGIGGIPRGRITEIFGGEASGKTTMALQTIANAQRLGIPCLYIDVEQSLDLQYAKKLGVNPDPALFVFAQPSCGEEALDIAREFIQSGSVGLVILDSVAAMSPRAELEGEISDATIGAQARLMGKAMRILTGAVRQHNVAFIMINQVRMKIGVMFGNPLDTPGGKALKYFSTLRIGLNQSKKLGKAGEETGHVVLARIAKNKLAPPFRKCEFIINFGKGVSLTDEMVPIGEAAGLWAKSGSWYKINGENVAQGSEKLAAYLRQVQAENTPQFEEYLKTCQNYTGNIFEDAAEEEYTLD